MGWLLRILLFMLLITVVLRSAYRFLYGVIEGAGIGDGRRVSNRGRTQVPAPFDHLTVDAWGQTRDQWSEHRKRFPWLDEVVVRAS